jgi:hypothetical protein
LEKEHSQKLNNLKYNIDDLKDYAGYLLEKCDEINMPFKSVVGRLEEFHKDGLISDFFFKNTSNERKMGYLLIFKKSISVFFENHDVETDIYEFEEFLKNKRRDDFFEKLKSD